MITRCYMYFLFFALMENSLFDLFGTFIDYAAHGGSNFYILLYFLESRKLTMYNYEQKKNTCIPYSSRAAYNSLKTCFQIILSCVHNLTTAKPVLSGPQIKQTPCIKQTSASVISNFYFLIFCKMNLY